MKGTLPLWHFLCMVTFLFCQRDSSCLWGFSWKLNSFWKKSLCRRNFWDSHDTGGNRLCIAGWFISHKDILWFSETLLKLAIISQLVCVCGWQMCFYNEISDSAFIRCLKIDHSLICLQYALCQIILNWKKESLASWWITWSLVRKVKLLLLWQFYCH